MRLSAEDLVMFDLDGTLLEGDSEVAWSEFLAAHGFIDRDVQQRERAEFEAAYTAGTLDAQAFLNLHLSPVRALKDKPREWFDHWNARFQQEIIAPMIRPAARKKVAEHIESGALVALVTATNSFLTAPVARELGIAHLIATRLEQRLDGSFTGNSVGTPAFREGKIECVEHWLATLGLTLRSFQQSWFYSDSCNDLPLLHHVTRPVAVDPDATLQAEARASAWPVISLR